MELTYLKRLYEKKYLTSHFDILFTQKKNGMFSTPVLRLHTNKLHLKTTYEQNIITKVEHNFIVIKMRGQ